MIHADDRPRICTMAAYAAREDAVAAKRRVLSTFRVHVAVHYCEICDRFHLDQSGRTQFEAKQWPLILRYVAQGLQDREIAPMVGMTSRSVEWACGQMMRRFYALSRAHLVAIAISLGIVDPNEFVPAIRQRFLEEPVNVERPANV